MSKIDPDQINSGAADEGLKVVPDGSGGTTLYDKINQLGNTLANHSLCLNTDNKTWSWGYNAYGQLGDGTTTSRLTPVNVHKNFGFV